MPTLRATTLTAWATSLKLDSRYISNPSSNEYRTAKTADSVGVAIPSIIPPKMMRGVSREKKA